MNLFKLSWSYIKRRKLSAFLNIALLAIGIASIVSLILVGHQLEQNMLTNGQGIDLVVGAKGSPTQLILSSIYHTDIPTGNISVAEAEKISLNPLVKKSIPLSIGDSFSGYRVIGTSHDYLRLYSSELSTGSIWTKPHEVVLGSVVAKNSGLALGDTLHSTHGLSGGSEHDDEGLVVAGILKASGTVLDRLILTDPETIWHAHEDESIIDLNSLPPHLRPMAEAANKAKQKREYTSLLVMYESSAAAASLPKMINSDTNLMAASPAVETARLFSLLDVFFSVIRGFAFLLVVVSLLGLFITLFNALKNRSYDLAMLRTLGAPRQLLFKHILLEGFILSVSGALLGLLLGHLAVSVLGLWSGSFKGLYLSGLVFHKAELIVLALAIALGTLAALIPAFQAFRSDIGMTLSKKG